MAMQAAKNGETPTIGGREIGGMSLPPENVSLSELL